MKLLKLVIFFFGAVVVAAMGEANQQIALEKKFETALRALRAERDASLDKLDKGFEGALNRVEKSAKEAADLDLVIETKKLRDLFVNGEKLVPSENTELKKIMGMLVEHSDKVRFKYGTSVNELIDVYVDQLTKIQNSYTKAGDVGSAVEVRKMIKAAKLRRVEDLPAPSKVAEMVKPPVQEDVVSEMPLPTSKSKLHDFLTNTVWSANGGYFRFRGDGTMTMPWHDCEWEVIKKDRVKMFTSDWHFMMNFEDDMKAVRVITANGSKEEWTGSFFRRHALHLDKKKCEAILTQGSWKREVAPGSGEFTFTSSGKIKSTTDTQTWREWEYVDGLIRLKGVDGGNKIKVDLGIFGDQSPYQLKRIGKEVRELQFQQKE